LAVFHQSMMGTVLTRSPLLRTRSEDIVVGTAC